MIDKLTIIGTINKCEKVVEKVVIAGKVAKETEYVRVDQLLDLLKDAQNKKEKED